MGALARAPIIPQHDHGCHVHHCTIVASYMGATFTIAPLSWVHVSKSGDAEGDALDYLRHLLGARPNDLTNFEPLILKRQPVGPGTSQRCNCERGTLVAPLMWQWGPWHY